MQKKNVLMMTMSLAMVGVVAVGGTLAYLTSNTKTMTNTFTVGSGYAENALKLDETAMPSAQVNPTEISTNSRTENGVGNDYAPMYPGSQIAKDPTLYLKKGSPVSYVFAKVENVDTLLSVKAHVDEEEVCAFIVSDKEAGTVVNEDTSKLSTTWKKIADVGTDGNPEYAADGKGFVITSEKLDGFYCLAANDGVVTVPTGAEDYSSLAPLFKSVTLRSDLTTMPSQSETSIGNIAVTGYAIQKDNLDTSAAALMALFPNTSTNE